MTEKVNPRVAGAFLPAISLGLIFWTEYDVQAHGTYFPKVAFFAPFFAFLGLDLVIHAPKIPIRTLTLRDGLYSVLGVAVAVFNLNRYGAFLPGSIVGIPVIVGLAVTAGIFAIAPFVQARRRTKG